MDEGRADISDVGDDPPAGGVGAMRGGAREKDAIFKFNLTKKLVLFPSSSRRTRICRSSLPHDVKWGASFMGEIRD